LEPIAIIRKQLEVAEPDLLRELLHDVVDRLTSAEVDGLTGAAHGRAGARAHQPARWRPRRRFDTRLGTPASRKSQVSEFAKSLDADVEAFRSRPLDRAPYRHLQADALALKVGRAAPSSTTSGRSATAQP